LIRSCEAQKEMLAGIGSRADGGGKTAVFELEQDLPHFLPGPAIQSVFPFKHGPGCVEFDQFDFGCEPFEQGSRISFGE